ncbi:MAG: hypothetical protein ACTSPV_14060 [Candidatus Hodarchaeales archaeon]
MPIETSDIRSNPNEQILFAAERIGSSKIKNEVFKEIHRGKKKIKTVSDIVKKTGLKRIQVLKAGNYLYNNRIIKKTKVDGELAYERDDFYFQNKKQILRLANDSKERAKYPTKRTPQISIDDIVIKAELPDKFIEVEKITIDDIDSFSKVKDIHFSIDQNEKPVPEEIFQQGLQRIINEEGEFKDWGGEIDDLYTNRIIYKGRRLYVAFGLKGKGTRGKLTPKKMGAQGDQIQRLFKAPADAFLIQYWNQIDESIIEQMHFFAIAKSALEGKTIYYGIIDGQDTLRLIQAYPECFDNS